jgi:hypothetical protein
MPPLPQIITPAVFRHVENETPSGIIDGLNVTFYTQHRFINDSPQVYLNGLRIRPGIGNDYTTPNDQTIVFNYAPTTGDVIFVDYFRR